jgi:GDPmannose 4,6-dehydratase
MRRVALITGITGQDGSYLAELLLAQGYKVFGMVRRSATPNYWRIQHILGDIELVEGDLSDLSSLIKVIKDSKPTEVYNLAAQSFVGQSFNEPIHTSKITGLGVLNVLEAVRQVDKSIKFYQASSSEMFGKVRETPQSEETPFHPRSPYGVAKVFGHFMTVNYRESYGMFAVSGILFNHESPRRGIEFVTRKITDGVARIKLGLETELRLGNLDARRDWGHARDYVKAMHLMLQQVQPEDFVIATGRTETVRFFVETAFAHAGLDPDKYVKVDKRFLRPAEVDLLVGDPSKAKQKLGWNVDTSLEDLIKEMYEEDLKKLSSSTNEAK